MYVSWLEPSDFPGAMYTIAVKKGDIFVYCLKTEHPFPPSDNDNKSRHRHTMQWVHAQMVAQNGN